MHSGNKNDSRPFFCPLSGEAKQAMEKTIENEPKHTGPRYGLLIHSGRREVKRTDGTVYDVENKKILSGNDTREWMEPATNTLGCLRLTQAKKEALTALMKELSTAPEKPVAPQGDCSEEQSKPYCTEWVVHIRNAAVPEKWLDQPAWQDPRVPAE